jgi:SNF2 family DNA or RNA helicase
MKYVPHEYQKKGIKHLISQACGALFLDPGLGKTSITLAAFKILKEKGYAKRMLVIAPLRVANSSWPRERALWDEFKDLRMCILHGAQRTDANLECPYDIYVINPEGLQWLFGAMKHQRWFFDILVIDESTRFKHTNTMRFKYLRPMLNKFKRRYILTGSPAPNGLMDLFGQIFILDQGASLGAYITHFRQTYFFQTGFGGYTWIPKAGADHDIYKKLGPLVLRMAAEDYLNMPPLVTNTVEVELGPEAEKIYREMETLLIAELEQKVVTAASAAVATMKCRQIANGGLFDGVEYMGKRAAFMIHEEKTEAVKDLVEELNGKPALVAYEFQHDLARLKEAFPDAPHLGGGVTANKQREIEDNWNAGRTPVLLAQPQSVAHGLNLQGTAAAVIFHSIPWDLELYEQLVRRVWRQGQKERVVVHHIVAKGTVDEAVMKALGKKDRTQRALLAALKEYVR